MRLINKLNLIVFIGATFDYWPDSENMGHKVFFIAVGVYSFFVLLPDFTCQTKSLLNNVFSSKFSSSILLVLVYALIVSFLISTGFLLQKIFCFWVISYLFNVFKQVMYILGLSEFFENSFLVGLKHFLLVLDHLSVLVVMIA